MCFSAEASFAASTVLAGVGGAAVQGARLKKLLLLAIIPCFFAAQQFAEGLVWLGLQDAAYHTSLTTPAAYLFLFFGWAVWPFWAPFAMRALEPPSWRKHIQTLCLLGGTFIALVNLIDLPGSAATIEVVDHSIQYSTGEPLLRLLYAIVVITPFLVSSLRLAWIVGVLGAIAAATTEAFFQATFTSVWCFFAAIISILFLVIVRKNRL